MPHLPLGSQHLTFKTCYLTPHYAPLHTAHLPHTPHHTHTHPHPHYPTPLPTPTPTHGLVWDTHPPPRRVLHCDRWCVELVPVPPLLLWCDAGRRYNSTVIGYSPYPHSALLPTFRVVLPPPYATPHARTCVSRCGSRHWFYPCHTRTATPATHAAPPRAQPHLATPLHAQLHRPRAAARRAAAARGCGYAHAAAQRALPAVRCGAHGSRGVPRPCLCHTLPLPHSTLPALPILHPPHPPPFPLPHHGCLDLGQPPSHLFLVPHALPICLYHTPHSPCPPPPQVGGQ